MPVSVNLDSKSGILVGTCSGPLKLADAQAGATGVWERPEWGGKPIVWDFRAAELEFSLLEVRQLAQFVLERRPPRPPSRMALVASRDVDFGLARMFEAFREDDRLTEVHVFREIDDAISWARGSAHGA